MTHRERRSTPPTQVRVAAGLLSAFGAASLVAELANQIGTDWVVADNLLWTVPWPAGCLVLAWALLTGRRWAWWTTVTLLGAWVLFFAWSTSSLYYTAATTQGFIIRTPLSSWVGLGTLLASEALLLMPASRRALRTAHSSRNAH